MRRKRGGSYRLAERQAHVSLPANSSIFLQTLSRLHRTRRNSNRCSFFAEPAGCFCIPRAHAVVENSRLCCSDNTESAAHRIITVQFAPQAHRVSLVGSRQLGSRPEPCNGLCSAHSATGRLAAQSSARSRHHVARSNRHGASGLPTAAHAPHTWGATEAKPNYAPHHCKSVEPTHAEDMKR